MTHTLGSARASRRSCCPKNQAALHTALGPWLQRPLQGFQQQEDEEEHECWGQAQVATAQQGTAYVHLLRRTLRVPVCDGHTCPAAARPRRLLARQCCRRTSSRRQPWLLLLLLLLGDALLLQHLRAGAVQPCRQDRGAAAQRARVLSEAAGARYVQRIGRLSPSPTI